MKVIVFICRTRGIPDHIALLYKLFIFALKCDMPAENILQMIETQ